MTTQPSIETIAPGSATPGATSMDGFVWIANLTVEMLAQLADEVRATEPGRAEMVEGFAELVAGQALDLIARWPS